MTKPSPQRLLEAMANLGMAPPGDPKTFLMPRAIKRILDPSVIVVLGPRGSGKSALATYLTQNPMDEEANRARAKAHGWSGHDLFVDAFSQRGAEHADVSVLDPFVPSVSEESLRDYWLVWLVLQVFRPFVDAYFKLHPEQADEAQMVREVLTRGRQDPSVLLANMRSVSRGQMLGVLDSSEEAIARSPHPILVHAVYDDLDMVGAFPTLSDPATRTRFIRALLGLWSSFSTRYKHIRAKIFLPTDLFDIRSFDTLDVSKLMARAERLDWDIPSLYRLVLRHLGAQGEDVRSWLSSFGVSFRDEGDEGWMPEEPSEQVIKAWLTATLRAVVAVNGTRSAAPQWIMNRLCDGNGRVAPRSLLRFFRESALIALRRPPRSTRGHLLAVEDAVDAIREVGGGRIDEIREVYEWVDRLLMLKGQVMPRPRSEVEALLEKDARDAPKETRPRDGRTVTTELIRLGTLRELPGDRLDVPDLFAGYLGVLRSPGEETQSRSAE